MTATNHAGFCCARWNCSSAACWLESIMNGKLLHEEMYRGSAELAKLSALQLVLCGAGALGSNLADNLTRQGFAKLRAIDHDRI